MLELTLKNKNVLFSNRCARTMRKNVTRLELAVYVTPTDPNIFF